jgi:hypothetical protein
MAAEANIRLEQNFLRVKAPLRESIILHPPPDPGFSVPQPGILHHFLEYLPAVYSPHK